MEQPQPSKQYDILCIGAGGAGISCARRARKLGKRVALIERSRISGTCVNFGCFPMKLFDIVSEISQEMDLAGDICLSFGEKRLRWKDLRDKVQAFIAKLRDMNLANCKKDGVDFIQGNARFVSAGHVEVDLGGGKGKLLLEAEHIVLCTGSKVRPLPTGFLGAEHTISTNELFTLENLPSKVFIIGGDYIGLELACMLKGLGIQVGICTAEKSVLPFLDRDVVSLQLEIMKKRGIEILLGNKAVAIDRTAKSYTVRLEDGSKHEAELVIRSVGRLPDYEGLGLDKIGVKLTPGGNIETDEFDSTAAKGVYAIGDSNGKLMLASVAVAAGRRLAMRLFAGKSDSKLDYTALPCTIFTHPAMVKCGLTEEEAIAKHGKDKVKVYKKQFNQVRYALATKEENKVPSLLKLVCLLPEEKVLGVHGVGRQLEEMIQGLSVAVRLGVCKRDLDDTVASHITVGEEFTTMF